MNPGDEVAGRYRLEELAGPRADVGGLARARRHARSHGRAEDARARPPTSSGSGARRGRSRRSRTSTSCASSTTARTRPGRSWRSSGCPAGRSRSGWPDGRAAAGARRAAIADGDRRRARASPRPRPRPPRPQAGERPLRRGGAAEARATSASRAARSAPARSPRQGPCSAPPRTSRRSRRAASLQTPASDVYSFGVLLFRMLTGALPFVADDALALVDMHRRGRRLRSRPCSRTPARARRADRGALRKDPAARPADGAALLAALGASAATVPVAADAEATRILAPVPAATPAATLPGGGRPGRRTALIAAGLVVLAVLGGLLAWAVTRPSSAAPAGVSTGSVPGTGKTHAHTATSTPTTADDRSDALHARDDD